MKFMAFVKSAEGAGFPPPALMEGIMNMGVEASKAGAMVENGGLMPSSAGSQLALKDGEIEITDGPFAEAREVVGGWAVYDVASKAEAVEWSRRFLELHKLHWPGWEGTVEVRQVMEGPPPSV